MSCTDSHIHSSCRVPLRGIALRQISAFAECLRDSGFLLAENYCLADGYQRQRDKTSRVYPCFPPTLASAVVPEYLGSNSLGAGSHYQNRPAPIQELACRAPRLMATVDCPRRRLLLPRTRRSQGKRGFHWGPSLRKPDRCIPNSLSPLVAVLIPRTRLRETPQVSPGHETL